MRRTRGTSTEKTTERVVSAGLRRRHPQEMRPSQREILRDVMMSASSRGMWLTLRQLAAITKFGEASISAQLRHLRKRQNGGYLIGRQLREPKAASRTATEPLWEYKLKLRRKDRQDAASTERTLRLLRDAIRAAREMDERRDTQNRLAQQAAREAVAASASAIPASEAGSIACSARPSA
jgi:hypothetical protein